MNRCRSKAWRLFPRRLALAAPLALAIGAWLPLAAGAAAARAASPAGANPPPAEAAAAPAALPLTFGGEIRLRGEAFDNILDLSSYGARVADGTRIDDAYQFWRFRYRLWFDARPRERLRLFLRLGNEYRMGQHKDFASIRDAESRVSLDNGWAELSWPLCACDGSTLALRFGRMDLMYGEGLLVMDGTPADGSASCYFDAIVGSYKRGDLKVDLLNAKLQDEGFGGALRDEDLYGLYAQWPGVEAYLLHRFQRAACTPQNGRPWAVTHPRQRTTALGARLSRLPATGFQAAVEGAYQFGEYSDPRPDETGGEPAGDADDMRARGGYARVGWIAESSARPSLEAGALYLSGDDHDTARYEGWDNFYAEWPKWSELLIYTFYDATMRLQNAPDLPGGPYPADDAGTWTNLTGAWLEWRLQPWRKTTFAMRGMLLGAAENNGGGRGSGRGTLLVGRLDVARWENVGVQLLGEWFRPGDYYRVTDDAWYARAQMTTWF